MPVGLSQEAITAIVDGELLGGGRYTLTSPGGRPIFTKEQRDAIARAVAAVIAKNNEEVGRK